MTVPIELAGISADRVVVGFSRYKQQKVIYYGPQRFLTFDTYIRKPYVPSGNEKIMVIKKGIEFRPDLVAFDVYGFTDAWWYILQANGMKDIMEFQVGVTIIIPNIV